MRRTASRLGCLVALAAPLLASCQVDYDFSRPSAELGTLGEEVWEVLEAEAARAPEARAARVTLVRERRGPIVDAIDTIAPDTELDALDRLTQRALASVDDRTLPGLTRKAEIALAYGARDRAVLSALADPRSALDFAAPAQGGGLVARAASYPQLSALARQGSALVLDNDAIGPDGQRAPGESDGFTQLTRTLADAIQEGVDPSAAADLARLGADLASAQDARYAAANDAPLWIATFDDRAQPVPTPEALATLFVDANADGRADLDEAGRFAMRDGSHRAIAALSLDPNDPWPRDAFGRAVDAEAEPIFAYLDASSASLAYLLRAASALASAEAGVDLLSSAGALLGPSIVREDERGTYQGFGPESAASALAHGAAHALAYDGLPELLRALAELVDSSPDQIAALAVAVERAFDAIDHAEGARLAENSTLLHDLIPLILEIVREPGLLEAIVDALADPMTLHMGDAFATMLSYRDTFAQVEPGGPYDACFQACKTTHLIATPARFECIRACPSDELFGAPIDHHAADGPGQRSQLQALWHLIWALSGTSYEMSISRMTISGINLPPPPPLIALTGESEAFMRALAGNLDLETAVPPELFGSHAIAPLLNFFGVTERSIVGVVKVLSGLFAIEIDRFPTHDQLTRMYNIDDVIFRSADGQTVLDLRESTDRDGYRLPDHKLADSLLEAEASGMLDAARPLIKAFSDRGREDLAVRIFIVLHDHWPSDASAYLRADGTPSRGAKGSNLRSYEPALLEIVEEGSIFVALHELARRLDEIKATRGTDLVAQLRPFLAHAASPAGLTTPEGALALALSDGRTIDDIAPLHLLFDGIERADRALGDDKAERERLGRALSALADALLGAEWPAGERARFADDGAAPFVGHAIDVMADRADTLRSEGRLTQWLTVDLLDGVEEAIGSRMAAGVVLIGQNLLETPGTADAISGFIQYMLAEPGARKDLARYAWAALSALADYARLAPLALFVADQIDPDRFWPTGDRSEATPLLSQIALTARATLGADTEGVIGPLARRAFAQGRFESSSAGVLAELIADYWREDPSDEAPLDEDDFALLFDRIARWLGDDRHGMEQIYDLVELRARD